MPHAFWSPEAARDIEEIAFYIAIDDGRPATADEVVRGIDELCKLIASQPEMGESRPEFGYDCRVFPYKKRWVALYRPVENGIQVLRVVDGSRDFDRLF